MIFVKRIQHGLTHIGKTILQWVICCCPLVALAQGEAIRDTSKHTGIHEELNMLQFYKRTAISGFHNAWKNSAKNKFVVVHVGDSHVQPDMYPHELRKRMQFMHGEGGRGMVFPYSTADSYSSHQYTNSSTGKWRWGKTMRIPPALPLGVMGMASRTNDETASFEITFKDPVPEHYTRLKLFCRKQRCSYDLIVISGGSEVRIDVDSIPGDKLPYYEMTIPAPNPTISVKLVKNAECDSVFEFYGMSLESARPGGFMIHSCGVGASRYRATLFEPLFVEQVKALEADVVILDYGTNDYLYDDEIKPELRNEIIQVIAKVRTAVPNATIIMPTVQDLFRKGRHRNSGDDFCELIHSIAKEQNCVVWDWFWISGGNYSIKTWEKFGLAQYDLVHLTKPGYELKGQFLSEAFINTATFLDAYATADSLVFKRDSLDKHVSTETHTASRYQADVKGRYAYKYKIKNGDNLGAIAMRYGVTVSQLMAWNNLRSTQIIAGRYLIIYRRKK
ncbi:MAG TPA: LysM peptidoglycan-binding domain-containing protein [Flavobacteriales bacterium]|nr:LysM peptidoglycan-binding domain-containing protein [Flavobacteriales bacterium]